MGGTTGTGKGIVLLTPTVEQLSDVSAVAPNDGDVLSYQAATGQWVPKAVAGTGTVTSVSAGVGLTASPNPIIGTGSIQLANTAVSAGRYSLATIDVDAQGRIVSAANGTAGSGSPGGSSGQIQYNNAASFGGTTGGTYSVSGNNFTFQAGSNSDIPLTVKLFSSAGAGDLQQWQQSNGAVLAKINASGNFNNGTNSITTHSILGDATDGLLLQSNNGLTVAILGPANTTNSSFLGGVTVSGLLSGSTATFSGKVSADAGLNTTTVSAASIGLTGDINAGAGRITVSAATITAKLTGATASFSGIVSADGGINTTTISAASVNVTGDILAAAGRISVSAATFTGLLTGATATFSGNISANGGIVGTTASFSGAVSANGGLATTTGSFSGKITGTTAAFSGLVSADGGISTTIVSAIRIIPTIVSVAFNGTTTVDASQASYFRGTAVSAFTLSANNAQDGQKIMYEIIQDGTGSRAITLGALFALGSDIATVVLTTTPSSRDFLGTFYNGVTNKHYVTAFVKGY